MRRIRTSRGFSTRCLRCVTPRGIKVRKSMDRSQSSCIRTLPKPRSSSIRRQKLAASSTPAPSCPSASNRSSRPRPTTFCSCIRNMGGQTTRKWLRRSKTNSMRHSPPASRRIRRRIARNPLPKRRRSLRRCSTFAAKLTTRHRVWGRKARRRATMRGRMTTIHRTWIRPLSHTTRIWGRSRRQSAFSTSPTTAKVRSSSCWPASSTSERLARVHVAAKVYLLTTFLLHNDSIPSCALPR